MDNGRLVAQINAVVDARIELAYLAAAKKELTEKWDADNRTLLDSIASAKEMVVGGESALRELAIQEYNDTGIKALAEGVGVREVTNYEYDPAEALEWAVEHKMALKLDETAFKKIVKATPLPFVNATIKPQATIAPDLKAIEVIS